MTINKEWHLAHKMPPRATLEQRIEWHLEHSRNCSCMPIPAKIMAEIEKRDIKKNVSKETES